MTIILGAMVIGDDNFDGDDDARLWPDASLDMIMMVMIMNISCMF